MESLTVEDLWIRELDKFEEAYRKDLKSKGLSTNSSEFIEDTKLPPPKAITKPVAKLT